MTVVDLDKQASLDASPKATQLFNFTGNLDYSGNTIMFFITEEAKETILSYFKFILL